MIVLQKNYPNGVTRSMRVTAVTATDDAQTVLLSTVEDGELALCALDQPDVWLQLEQAGGLPA